MNWPECGPETGGAFSYRKSRGRAALILLFLFAAIAAALAFLTACETWNASVDREIDFTRPVEEIPANFRVGVGGRF